MSSSSPAVEAIVIPTAMIPWEGNTPPELGLSTAPFPGFHPLISSIFQRPECNFEENQTYKSFGATAQSV